MELFYAYLEHLQRLLSRDDAREESLYPALKELIEALGKAQSVQVTMLPKKTDVGSPDFRVWDGSGQVIGYIEAKKPGTDLNAIEHTDQLKRYRDTFPNLILTDFYRFRLYREGILLKEVTLAQPAIAVKVRTKPPLQDAEGFRDLMEQFLTFTIQITPSPEELAQRLAKRTRFLRDEVLLPELKEEEALKKGALLSFYEAFRKYLIPDLKPEEFADLYAQTLTYGLFIARIYEPKALSRQIAFERIPESLGILREIFQYVSLKKASPQMEALIDDIASVLNAVDMPALFSQYAHEPILHFYETFLAHYDPAERERRGVYYTPLPVVRYIVRAVDYFLRRRFGREEGLADKGVTLLDPAAGTLTFIVEAIQLAIQTYTRRYGEGAKERLIRERILPNFYAFELLMAPYAIGHLHITYFLEALGIQMGPDERFQLYLTNALEMADIQQVKLPFVDALSEEHRKAAHIKKDTPILVILGNPPYSGHSATTNEWTERLLKNDIDGAPGYYAVAGVPLGEKNPKWLQDDYVKFLRFAQWKVHKAGRGIVAMITNHSYLDNPTFRGMRYSLLQTFDEIYLLDLHGNSLKREKAPDGSVDENVFNIRQGVAIAIFIKHGKPEPKGIHHAEIFGSREKKFEWLDTHDMRNTPFQRIEPRKPLYLFQPDHLAHSLYHDWIPINELFPHGSVGIVTARDTLTIQFSAERMWEVVRRFSRMDPEIAREAYKLGKDVRDWKVAEAQKDLLANDGPNFEKIVPILYRPFDIRFTYYTGKSRGFLCMPRPDIMRHMLAGENVSLVVSRQVKASEDWRHILVANKIIESCYVSNNTSEIGYLMPLYLYENESEGKLALSTSHRQPNLNENLMKQLEQRYGRRVEPEEVLGYVYGVLYAPVYRARYRAALRRDFPRIPFPSDVGTFETMARLGKELVDLHLLRQVPESPSVRYEGVGPDTVGKVIYDAAEQRVYINVPAKKKQRHVLTGKYFEGISPAMWSYQIGGYAVLQKWLKDREGASLSTDDIEHYIKVARVIARTIALQPALDKAYEEVERSLVREDLSV